MTVGEGANDWGGNGLAEREERAEGTAQKHNVVSVIDGFGEGILVCVQGTEDVGE